MLLTSAGLRNATIVKTLKKLAGGKISTAFIPTAANLEPGDKSWMIKSFNDFLELGSVDIVDISAMDKKSWLPRLRAANVIAFGGGDPLYMMRCITKSGLEKELPKLLKSRVYIGMSAGSVIASKKLLGSFETFYGGQKGPRPAGLGYVPFNFRPHLDSPYFKVLTEKTLHGIAKRLPEDTYAVDDNTAVLVIDGKVKIVSEGHWKLYSNKK